MKIIKLQISTQSETYPIFIGYNLLKKINEILNKNHINFKKCLFIIDRNVPKKFIKELNNSLKSKKILKYYFNANERNKNQKSINSILKILLNNDFSRQDCVISIGGGITGDVGGFAASLFKRGLQFINIPTTLLSQVDSSVGGKTGINTEHGKNLIGTFYQPKIVLSDTKFLRTLPKREIVCGYAEILKHSIIMNKKFFNYLNNNFLDIFNLSSPYIEKAIYDSCKIKKLVVEKDEKEKGLRKTLNFGHTFAHAFEASLDYSKRLNHGEAVILGMVMALKFSLKKNLINKRDFEIVENHIKYSKLPSKIKKFFSQKDVNKILKFMIKDKKNTSSLINLILLKKIGQSIIDKKFRLSDLKIFLKKELAN